jgi:hypothetical protein
MVHAVLAAGAWDRSPVAAGFLVAMAAACLTCTPSLWRGGALHSWMTMLGLAGVMLFVHWDLCFACGSTVHAASDLDVGVATHLFGQGLGSLALWLMVAEMAVAVVAIVRQLSRSIPNQPEVVLS